MFDVYVHGSEHYLVESSFFYLFYLFCLLGKKLKIEPILTHILSIIICFISESNKISCNNFSCFVQCLSQYFLTE